MARHPFQRKSNPKDTVKTPFQRALVAALGFPDLSRNGSGRRVSEALKKSANHVSLMMNDGFIPSGASVVEMTQSLGLDDAARDEMILAAIETKASQRSRDNFWLTEMLRFHREALFRAEAAEDFLRSRGLRADFEVYRACYVQKPRVSAILAQQEARKS